MRRRVNGIKGVVRFIAYFIGLSLILGGIWALVYSFLIRGGRFYYGLFMGTSIGAIVVLVNFLFRDFLKDILFSYIENVDIGELRISSGELLICDPFFLKKIPNGVIELKGLKTETLPIDFTIKKFGKMKRIIRAEFGKEKVKGVRKLLGQIPVVSNSICLVDKQSFTDKFQFQGVERVGMVYGDKHKEIAQKIKEKLELDFIEESPMTSKFLQTITENLERGIRTFLNQEEKEAFFIWTNNSYDKLSKKLGENYKEDYTYTLEVLEEGPDNIIVFSTIRDKYHKVYGIFDDSRLAKIVVEME